MSWNPFEDGTGGWEPLRPRRPKHPFHPQNRIRRYLPIGGAPGLGGSAGTWLFLKGAGARRRHRTRAPRRRATRRKRTLLDRLAEPVRPRGCYPRFVVEPRGLPPVDRPVEFRVEAVPWPTELDLPVFTVTDPEPDRAPPNAGTPVSLARRDALVQRASLIARALRVPVTILLAPHVGIRIAPDGTPEEFDLRGEPGSPGSVQQRPRSRERAEDRRAAADQLRARRALGWRRPDRE